MDSVVLATLGLGFTLGMRHAFDPDHVVAVSAIVSGHRGVRRSSLVGTFWGLGHTTALLAIGVAALTLQAGVPERFALWAELGVGVMLVALGASTVRGAVRGWRIHLHRHTHDGRPHVHLHLHRPDDSQVSHEDHRHLRDIGARPFVVGLIHGLAGSAGVVVLALGTLPSVMLGLVFIAVFGLGSVGGMLAVCGLMSLWFVRPTRRARRLAEGLRFLAGLGSLGFGLFWLGQWGLHGGGG